MKKTSRNIFPIAGLLGGLLFTSCLGEGTNKYHGDGVFTVVKDGSSYCLFADYGGLIIPDAKSVYNFSGNDGLKDGDRVYMIYQYTDDNIKNEQGKGGYIADVELVQGQRIPKFNILMQAEAEAQNLLDKDSLFTITTDANAISFGAYRGYLTSHFNGIFSVVSNKGVYPTLNMVYDPAENERPNELNLKVCYNRHTATNAASSTDSFFTTYPLTPLSGRILGSDSITINIDGVGLPKKRTLKISRDDLKTGNYLYYK